MRSNKLVVEKQPDELTNGENIAVKFEDHLVFAATRYDKEDYSSVFWRVNPNKSKEDYFRQLVAFYKALRFGGFEDSGERVHPLGIMLDKTTETPLPLEYLNMHGFRLLEHPSWKSFGLLRIDSPYAALTMEDFSGEGWKPETGMITVISHNDLSVRVAELIAETSKYYVPAGKLQPVLAQNVYNFR